MNAEKFFRQMYFDIWQSNNLSRLDDYYSKDFRETIQFTNADKQPVECHMNYTDLVRQAEWQAKVYQNTTFDIKKIVMSGDGHICVQFYSTSVVKETGELRHRCVCGIWHLNSEHKIDRVWAVVTPYYDD